MKKLTKEANNYHSERDRKLQKWKKRLLKCLHHSICSVFSSMEYSDDGVDGRTGVSTHPSCSVRPRGREPIENEVSILSDVWVADIEDEYKSSYFDGSVFLSYFLRKMDEHRKRLPKVVGLLDCFYISSVPL
ncbi:uncharacterized protein LOC124931812 isoform X2 [Impatiens glandulifera]|uniref:uncharacterized protein LOC124931812 isoform X2 n=1 Tax=Impatiens glandulifera TaxID=253017 RepID=UPI001FB0E78C|nr:uncharacterized protein LOC124931812 isoform X2 [Impatiens glandulifera]XP_047328330.1 uncharacterized protein LOC124931812 isoform X2 [Impatiens glandulifera]XP_047328331.1 uncharacterized protein LOC124931812 isoform X2 [Impatiens glandulifera]